MDSLVRAFWLNSIRSKKECLLWMGRFGKQGRFTMTVNRRSLVVVIQLSVATDKQIVLDSQEHKS